jgi:hypothetical protein
VKNGDRERVKIRKRSETVVTIRSESYSIAFRVGHPFAVDAFLGRARRYLGQAADSEYEETPTNGERFPWQWPGKGHPGESKSARLRNVPSRA